MVYFVGQGAIFFSNYAIFQEITSLKALYIINSEMFETGLKQWPHFSQATHNSYIYKIYFKGIKACCALVFAAVLAIPSEISGKQCLKRIPDLVRSRTVLLRLEVTIHVPR